MLKTTDRELATILAALRLWQQIDNPSSRRFYSSNFDFDALDEIATNAGTLEALDENEIDIFIDKLNALEDPKFINVDWELLSDQKLWLMCFEPEDHTECDDPDLLADAEKAQGLINFIDAMQDYAVDVCGIPECEVMRLSEVPK